MRMALLYDLGMYQIAFHLRPYLLIAVLYTGTLLLTACLPPAVVVGDHRAAPPPAPPVEIPGPARHMTTLPPAGIYEPPDTYSVTVDDIDVRELLFALARDSGVNIDIHPGIDGRVTMTAVEQTLSQLLNRIARQADVRWEIDGDSVSVLPDTPFLRTYVVDYVNMSRETTGNLQVATQIASTGGSIADPVISTGNNSSTQVSNRSHNHFWETLELNIKELLRETDKILPDGSSETSVETRGLQPMSPHPRQPSRRTAPTLELAPPPSTVVEQSGSAVVKRVTFREAASVIVSPETGVVAVRATSHQHEKVQDFLVHIAAAARRQVLIEATIAEVTLADGYQQGIDWSALPLGRSGFSLVQKAVGDITEPASSVISLAYNNSASRLGNVAATVKLLESFGSVRVLSSPKLSAINNQTAVLKVVDNIVYFTLKTDTVTNQTTTTTTYSTNLHSVPVGLVVNVTAQISDADTVLLNIRPSISRRYGQVIDPNPDLQKLGVSNLIPVIRTREMESVIRVDSGQVAVMGGLMEEVETKSRQSVPMISRLPVVGTLFQDRDESSQKTELVIFLRPTVLKDASLDGDFAAFKDRYPAANQLPPAPLHPRSSALGETGGTETRQGFSIHVQPHRRPTGLADAYRAFRSGDLEAAAAHFTAVLTVDSHNVEARQGMATIALRTGDMAEAREHCLILQAHDPLSAFATACLIGFDAGADRRAAESRLRSLLAKQGQMAILHFALGNQLAAQSRWAEARQCYGRANELLPGDAATLFNLAISLDHGHQADLAGDYYRQALQTVTAQPAGIDRAAAARRLAAIVSSEQGQPGK